MNLEPYRAGTIPVGGCLASRDFGEVDQFWTGVVDVRLDRESEI